MIRLTVILLLIGLSARAELRPEMQRLYFLADKMQNYSFNKSEYLNPKNEKEIAENLREFTLTVNKIKQEKIGGEDDMKFRLKQLNEGLNDAEQAFKDGFKDYSFWALKSTLNNCYSCHTQKGLGETQYKMSAVKKAAPFVQAEFLFLVRNYKEAIPLFEKLATNYPKALTSDELETSLQKLLYYSVRVKKNDAETSEMLGRISKNKELPEFVKRDIAAWTKYLAVKKFGVADEADLTSAAALENYITDRNNLAANYRLGNQRYLLDLETDQKLFDLLGKSQDKNLRPWVLYWLAYQEKDYRQNMFDMSAEYYLIECLEKYSSNPAAKRCLALYKEIQAEAYTGSRGTEIPRSMKNTLDSYEKLINGK